MTLVVKMADTVQLDGVEKRISALESIVFGNADKDALYPKDKPPRIQCIESLLALQTKILASVDGKKKTEQVFANLPQLRQYMDPAYTDELILSDEAKSEIVLAEEDFLNRMASQLQVIKENEGAINSEHVRNVPKLSEKLQELSKIQIKQQDETAEVTEEAAKLIDSYNSTITTLSKIFIQWDEELTRLEMASKPKKSDS
ncbi:dynactin subunit 3-like isoform X1 [Pomacea canaliculata]|uniref:dynactin subunit 3-like isoform X1 n=1 Tax=Pomacea canaliculata TaxID=400727 RepID=UPI000D73E627|nr:dynactin subunit 3-like isoform X1 [Pomacea canaliculata]